MKFPLKSLGNGKFGLILVLLCPFIFLFFYIATERSNYDLGRTSTDAIWNISNALLDLNKLERSWMLSVEARTIKEMVEQQQIILSYLDNIQEIDRKYHHYDNYVVAEITAATNIISSWTYKTLQSDVRSNEIIRARENLDVFYLQTGTTQFSSDWIYRNTIMFGSFIVFLISFFVLVKHIRTTDITLVELEKSQEMLIESRQDAIDALEKLEKSRGLLIETRQTALTKIASNVFHEFSNCLWLTALLAEEALLKKKSRDKNTAISKIQSHLRKTREMLGNLRTYVRGEKLTTVSIDLGRSISNLEPLLETISGPEVELELQVERGCLIKVVPDHIRQIVTNLAKNAVEAMPSGGKLHLSVKLTNENPGHIKVGERWVVLTVSDTGIGMGEDVLSRVFTPFFSINKEGGTGLGLTGVENWVIGANGNIQIESNVGKGSMFSVYFPNAHRSIPNDILHDNQADIATERATILLIDDEQQALELQAASLRRENFHVFTVSDPRHIETDKVERADLLISDIRMPYKDGLALAMELQLVKKLPVIFLTGDELASEMEKTIEQIFPNAQIAFKPISTSQLTKIILSTMATQADA
ncbi:MAG: response regulator [Sneathiella sp.]|nr:response regulator [Sneathiella sp.]